MSWVRWPRTYETVVHGERSRILQPRGHVLRSGRSRTGDQPPHVGSPSSETECPRCTRGCRLSKATAVSGQSNHYSWHHSRGPVVQGVWMDTVCSARPGTGETEWAVRGRYHNPPAGEDCGQGGRLWEPEGRQGRVRRPSAEDAVGTPASPTTPRLSQAVPTPQAARARPPRLPVLPVAPPRPRMRPSPQTLLPFVYGLLRLPAKVLLGKSAVVLYPLRIIACRIRVATVPAEVGLGVNPCVLVWAYGTCYNPLVPCAANAGPAAARGGLAIADGRQRRLLQA
jgi:hypothetical protein